MSLAEAAPKDPANAIPQDLQQAEQVVPTSPVSPISHNDSNAHNVSSDKLDSEPAPDSKNASVSDLDALSQPGSPSRGLVQKSEPGEQSQQRPETALEVERQNLQHQDSEFSFDPPPASKASGRLDSPEQPKKKATLPQMQAVTTSTYPTEKDPEHELKADVKNEHSRELRTVSGPESRQKGIAPRLQPVSDAGSLYQIKTSPASQPRPSPFPGSESNYSSNSPPTSRKNSSFSAYFPSQTRTESFGSIYSLQQTRSSSVYVTQSPRRHSQTSPIYRPPGLIRLDSDVLPERNSITAGGLISVVAETLDVPKGDVDLIDSFRDLGGDWEDAENLRAACLAEGIDIPADDILECPTLAELQTRAKPCIPSTAPPPLEVPPVVQEASRSTERLSEGSRETNSNDDEEDCVFTDPEPQGRRSDSMDGYSSAVPSRSISSDSKISSVPQLAPKYNDAGGLEQLIMSTSRVAKACLVKPRAGPFDGQLVAFITTAAMSLSDSKEIRLPPESQHNDYRKDMNMLRLAAQEWGSEYRQPAIWVPLQSMALTEEGKPDERRLRTFIQNINDTAESTIMSFQLVEPRPKPRDVFSQAKMQSSEHLGGFRKGSADSGSSFVRKGSPTTDKSKDIEFFPLSPMQQLYFRTSMNRGGEASTMASPSMRFNQSILLQMNRDVKLPDVEAAVEALVARHSMLRARFRLTSEGWAQIIMPQTSKAYHFGYHRTDDDETLLSIIEKSQAAINVTKGPVFAAEHIWLSSTSRLLYLVAHHLVVDLKSWQVIIHDLDELLQEGTLLNSQSTPFPHWIEYQNYETSQRLVEPVLPFEVTPANRSYWSLMEAPNSYGDTDQLSFSLPPDLTSILQKTCNGVLRTESSDIFLAALLQSFSRTFTDRAVPTMWKQETGRESKNRDFDIDQTVGWFTTLCPLQVAVDPSADFIQLLKAVKDTRKSIPRQGIPFFTSEFSATKSPFNVIPVEVMFNCVDTLQQLPREDGILEAFPIPNKGFSSLASDVGPDVGRIALFEVSVVLEQAGTKVEVLYNKASNYLARIHTWVESFEHSVLEAIGRLRAMDPELTLSDVPLLKATYQGLQRLNWDRLHKLGLDSVDPIETILPVSPAQQEILISQGLDLDTYHVRSIYELVTLDGSPVDQARLCSAWEDLVASNVSLRSIFMESLSKNGLFDQVILKKISPIMLFLDAECPEETLASLPVLRTLPAQPRHRLSVCRSPQKTFIRIDASQAICDPTSVHNLVTQLGKAYRGESLTVNNALLPTYLYHVSSLDTSYSMGVWKVNLADPKPCNFPQLTIEPQRQLQSRSFRLDISRKEVYNFCRNRKVEPSTLLQLGWAMVLRAFVGMSRVTFGYQHHGRDEGLLGGIKDAIGSFATVLPTSVDLSGSHTLLQCLQEIGEQVSSSHQLHALTSSEIQHILGMTSEKLFNTCFSYHEHDPEFYSAAASLSFQPNLVTSTRTSDSDLCISSTFINQQLLVNASFRYLTNAQAHNIISTFERAIRVVLEDATQTISDVELFTDRDYAQIVVKDFQSQRTDKVSQCVHHLAQQHARSRPDAPAICAWDGDLTYSQMATFVSRLSTYLVNLGIQPGVTVPIVLEKNRWAPVMMLAVLQAGGSFISLDCQDNITTESTIRQLNPDFVLCCDFAFKDVSAIASKTFLINDHFFSTLPPQLSAFVEEPSPEHAACIFFSPSKGSSISSRSIFFTHASLCSAFVVQGPALKIDESSRVLQISAFNMDIALVEILGTLVHGGCVCIPSAGQRMHDIAGAINRMSATWTYLTAVLARRIQPSSVPGLRTICFRTRNLDEDTYIPWTEKVNVLLAYGAPDVCPLGISVAELSKAKEATVIPPPLLGQFWILNSANSKRLMPVGAVGELGIDSPILTPHKFVPGEPLVAPEYFTDGSEKVQSRYLKTGHRVRYVENGNIKFMSTMRDDVMMGGSQVMVGEVERFIRQCLGGADVVVDAVTTGDSIQILAAFIEFGDQFTGPEDLQNLSPVMKEQAFKAKKLVENALTSSKTPSTMIPPHHTPPVFVPIKSLPISASLKVNRRKLQRMVNVMPYSQLLKVSTVPNPKAVQQALFHDKPLPLTNTEETMTRIWAGVLNLVPHDIQTIDTFIGLGGDNHLAAKLIVACREAGYTVSFWDLVKGASLTEVCQSTAAPATEHLMEPASPLDSRRISVHPLKSIGFDNKFIKEVICPQLHVRWAEVLDIAEASSQQIRALELGLYGKKGNVKCLVINFNGPIRHQRLEVACETLTRLHPILRTAFSVHDRRVYQVLVDSFKPEFKRYPCPTWRLDSVTEHVVKQKQMVDLQPGEPATHFSLFDSGELAKLVIRLSSAQVDDATVSLLVEDLGTLYEGTRHVSRKPTFYEYMRAAQVANYKNSVDYWKGQLRDANMTQVVKHSKPYPPVSEVTTLRETIKVNALSHYGLNFDTVLKAAWAIVLSTVSGQSDVLFGEAIQGYNVRMPEGVDVTSIAGPMANTIPVRVGFPGTHSSPLDLMQYIQGQRSCSKPFESLGILDVVHRCTHWSYWTRFSTVVQHRHQPPADGSTTLNMGSTTFTYELLEPVVHDIPDIFVCSTMDGPRNTDIALSFSESRVPRAFAQELLTLLISSVAMLTDYDSVTMPLIQSASEIEQQEARIPLPALASEQENDVPEVTIPAEQRAALQSIVHSAWTQVIDPSSLGVPGPQIHRASFYDLWGSLLPAHFFAEHLNAEMPKLKIPGIDRVKVTAEEMIENPSMMTQYELITRKMRDMGFVPTPVPSRRLSLGPAASHLSRSNSSVIAWTPSAPSTSATGLAWKRSLKLRHNDSFSSIRPKATRWVKHKVNLSRDSAIPEDETAGEGLQRHSDDAARITMGMGNKPKVGLKEAKPQQPLGTFDGYGMKYDDGEVSPLSTMVGTEPVQDLGQKLGRKSSSSVSPLKAEKLESWENTVPS